MLTLIIEDWVIQGAISNSYNETFFVKIINAFFLKDSIIDFQQYSKYTTIKATGVVLSKELPLKINNMTGKHLCCIGFIL